MNEYEYPDVDRGWAWVVLVASFLANVMNGIINYSVGILHVAFLEQFKEDVASTAFVGSVFSSLICLCSPLVSFMVNTTSCRITMIFSGVVTSLGLILSFFTKSLVYTLFTYGIIAGTGLGFSCTPCYITLGYSFQKYLSVSVGVVASGAGVGMLTGGPVLQMILDNYGLQGSFLLLGGISLHIIVFGCLMKPSSLEVFHRKQRLLHYEEQKTKTSNTCSKFSKICGTGILKNKAHLAILLSVLLWNMVYSLIILHLSNFSIVMGSTKSEAAMLLFWIGLGSTLSRVLSGLISGEKAQMDPVLLDVGVLGLTGALTLLFPLYAAENWQRCLFAVLFGVYSGGLITFIVPLCMEVVGLNALSAAIGHTWFACGIGSITGPVIAGVIIDKTGHYSYAFHIGGIILILSAFFVLLSAAWRPKDLDSDNLNEHNKKTGLLFSESKTLSGSGFLTSSLSLVYNLATSNRSLEVISVHTINKCTKSFQGSKYTEETVSLKNSHL